MFTHGLVEECLIYIKDLSLPDITIEKIDKNSWKYQVKLAIKELNKKEVKEDLEGSMKGKEFANEEYGTKEYFKTLSLHDARTIFKKRSKITQHIKMNFPSDEHYRKKLWKCDSCQSAIDTQSYVLWCRAYVKLRENKDLNNDQDIAQYLQEVLEIRSNLNINK